MLVRGHPLDTVRNWYHDNMGYTMQLASPYFGELTVRENLLFCALMRLPHTMGQEQIFERVERVIREAGLLTAADVVVEGDGKEGGGISGGQVSLSV